MTRAIRVLTVRLAKVEGILGFWLAPTLEESLRLTAAEGMDWNGKLRCAIEVKKRKGESLVYIGKWTWSRPYSQ